jgi:hypothetical protein
MENGSSKGPSNLTDSRFLAKSWCSVAIETCEVWTNLLQYLQTPKSLVRILRRGQLDQNWDDLQQLKALKREEDAEWRKQQREEKARARVEEMEQQGTTEGDGEIVVEEGAENGRCTDGIVDLETRLGLSDSSRRFVIAIPV